MRRLSVQASAPGKAVLSGEYAVLEGAPAIAMAVNCRARVKVDVTANAGHSVASPGLHDETLTFRTRDDGSIGWPHDSAAEGEYALLEQVWRCVRPSPAGGLALTLDTRDFFAPAGSKLGFGSSAALAAALTAAFVGSDAGADALYRTAALAHRHFQGGKGSGVDVAAAVYGGVIGFCMHRDEVEKLEWPHGLHFGLLWSGQPASTAGKLARLEDACRNGVTSASAASLADAAATVHEAWGRGNAAAVTESLAIYAEALQRFSADRDLGVFDAGHKELYDEALRCGLVYKPCGAGGGDVGAVFAIERDAVVDFANRARRYGFELLDVQRDPGGVAWETGL